MLKTCTCCVRDLPLDQFNSNPMGRLGLNSKCKRCKAIQTLITRKKNRPIYNRHVREWRGRHPEKSRALDHRRYLNNKPKIVIRNRIYRRRKYQSDLEFRSMESLRRRMQMAMKGRQKEKSTRDLIGCTGAEFRSHIESQFVDGMTWLNYGKWHIDHRFPCASFDLTDPIQQRSCFHFTNLQPLWAADNRRKGARIPC